jgi:hypothetical protein
VKGGIGSTAGAYCATAPVGLVALSVLSLSLECLPALFLPLSRADAGVLICRSHYTDSGDRARLRNAMQQALPIGVSGEGTVSVCRNRGSARAWLSTWSRPRSDGATEWWDVSCRRNARDWECETPVHRHLVWVYVELDGVLRRLEVSFDDATGLARARVLAVRAMQFIQDPASGPLPGCQAEPSADSRLAWEKMRRMYALTAKDTAVALAVESNERGAVDVFTNGGVGGLALTFTDGSGRSPSNDVCWGEWVVVG